MTGHARPHNGVQLEKARGTGPSPDNIAAPTHAFWKASRYQGEWQRDPRWPHSGYRQAHRPCRARQGDRDTAEGTRKDDCPEGAGVVRGRISLCGKLPKIIDHQRRQSRRAIRDEDSPRTRRAEKLPRSAECAEGRRAGWRRAMPDTRSRGGRVYGRMTSLEQGRDVGSVGPRLRRPQCRA